MATEAHRLTRTRSALLTLDLSRIAELSRSHFDVSRVREPREAAAWVDAILDSGLDLRSLIGECTAVELRKMCLTVGIDLDPRDVGVQAILSFQVSRALGLERIHEVVAPVAPYQSEAEAATEPVPVPPSKPPLTASEETALVNAALVAGAAGPLPVDIDYPLSTAAQRVEGDRVTLSALDWRLKVRALVARFPDGMGTLADIVTEVVDSGEALADAQILCQAFVAMHDRAQVAAEETEVLLLQAVRELAEGLAADPMTVPFGNELRDILNWRGIPAFEMIARLQGLVPLLSRLAKNPSVIALVLSVGGRLEPYRVARLKEVHCRDRARAALEARAETHGYFIFRAVTFERRASVICPRPLPKGLAKHPERTEEAKPAVFAWRPEEILQLKSLPTLSWMIFEEADQYRRTLREIAAVAGVPEVGVARIVSAVYRELSGKRE